jgi:chaperonin cofactor prefoldin
MEKEIIETVLTEVLEELKELKKLNIENAKVAMENGNRLMAIEKKVLNHKLSDPYINTQYIERIIMSGMEKINARIDQKPAAARREFRILLFPEYNTKEYYRIVFGRIVSWLVLLVIAKYFYLLANEWISRH